MSKKKLSFEVIIGQNGLTIDDMDNVMSIHGTAIAKKRYNDAKERNNAYLLRISLFFTFSETQHGHAFWQGVRQEWEDACSEASVHTSEHIPFYSGVSLRQDNKARKKIENHLGHPQAFIEEIL